MKIKHLLIRHDSTSNHRSRKKIEIKNIAQAFFLHLSWLCIYSYETETYIPNDKKKSSATSYWWAWTPRESLPFLPYTYLINIFYVKFRNTHKCSHNVVCRPQFVRPKKCKHSKRNRPHRMTSMCRRGRANVRCKCAPTVWFDDAYDTTKTTWV